MRGRVAIVVLLGALTVATAAHAVGTATTPSSYQLLLVVVLLGPALVVEVPLRLGNRRVQVAGLFEAALIVCLALNAPGSS